MSRLIVTGSEHVTRTPDGHAILLVRPEVADLHADADDVDGWAEHAEAAINVAGTLARVALDVSDAIAVTGQAHRCDRRIWPDQAEPGAEIVDGAQYDGCKVYLAHSDRHLIGDGSMPYLVAHVPPNRERAWTKHLAHTVGQVVDLDRRSMLTVPTIE